MQTKGGPRWTYEALSHHDQQLLDEFAIQATPAAIADAMRGYDHFCPTVNERAAERAYEVAKAMMDYRSEICRVRRERHEAEEPCPF